MSRLSLITEAARALNAELPQDELLQVLTDTAREAVGAHQAVITLTKGDDIAAVSLSEEYADRKHPPLQGSLTIPLVDGRGESIGLIRLSDKYEGDFTEEDEELAATFAELAVLAIDGSRARAERVGDSDERYRSLVEMTQDLIWTVDAEGRYEFVSGAVESIYGYTAEEMIGRSFLDFVPPERRDGDVERLSQGLEGHAAQGEAELVRKDGTIRTVEFRSIPLKDTDGNVVAIIGASTDVTRRKRSEQAVRESEERFRGLFENAVIGMALMDSDGRFVQANPAFCRLLGRSQDELGALAWLDAVHPDDRDIPWTRRAGAGESRAFEARVVHRDGHVVWARVMGASVAGAGREPSYTLVQAIDLTEQRRLEEATSRLYALTRDLFCTLGFDGYLKSVNPAWERALGYSADELLSKPFLEFVHENDRRRTALEFDRLRVGGEMTLNFENRHLHSDGTDRWLLWSTYASPDEELVYGVAKDVTDRKRSEERLRESERKYRDLVETSSDLIWSLDKHARFTFVNRAAKRIYGYEPEEMLGRPLADFETDEKRVEDMEAFKSVLSGMPLFDYQTRHIRKDGRVVDLSLNAIVLHDDDGVVIGATGTATDVTDRRRFDARQAAVAELGRRALEGVRPEEITDAAVALVSETLGLEYSEVVERLPSSGEFRIHAAVGWPQAVGSTFRGSAEFSHSGFTVRSGEPVVVEDLATETRFQPSRELIDGGVRSGICVTIQGEGGPFGVLSGHSKRRRSFSADEVNFMQALANVLGTAIDRKRAEERIVQLAAARGRLVAQTLAAEDRARRSISEVLHDHALQDLLASRQDLMEVIEDPEGDPERVVRAREGIERAVQLLREAVFNLHPVVLEHAGLASAIRAVADDHGRRGGFDCTIEVAEDATGVHDELILSLARELLTNVSKHAQASNVLVRLTRRDGGWIELVVEDDGRGIEPGRREEALQDGHVGLASSGERVEAMAGTFNLENRPGGGTTARALLPTRRAVIHPGDTRNLSRLSEARREPGR